MSFLTDLHRKFILTEGNVIKPSLLSYVESIIKVFDAIKPHSVKEFRYFEMIKHYLRELKNGIKKLQDEKQELEERISTLEEKLNKRKK